MSYRNPFSSPPDDQRVAAAGQSLGVVLRRAVGEWVRRVVDEGQLADADLFAYTAGEQGATLYDFLAGQRSREDPQQCGCHPAVEDGGQFRAPGLPRPEKSGRAVDGVCRGGLEVELARRTADRVAEPRLGVVAISGDGVDEEVAACLPIASPRSRVRSRSPFHRSRRRSPRRRLGGSGSPRSAPGARARAQAPPCRRSETRPAPRARDRAGAVPPRRAKRGRHARRRWRTWRCRAPRSSASLAADSSSAPT